MPPIITGGVLLLLALSTPCRCFVDRGSHRMLGFRSETDTAPLETEADPYGDSHSDLDGEEVGRPGMSLADSRRPETARGPYGDSNRDFSRNLDSSRGESRGDAERASSEASIGGVRESNRGLLPRGDAVDETPRRRLPGAIIIGVKKGGTRALLETLRLHPDVRAVGAEPHFFDRNYLRGLEWYRSLMPPTLEGQLTMEKTPSYFVTEAAPARISALARDGGDSFHSDTAPGGAGAATGMRLVVVVRDPVTRAISDYAQTLSKQPPLPPPPTWPRWRQQAPTAATAGATNVTRIPSFEALAFHANGSVDPGWSAVRIGLYAQHLAHWLRHFPLRRMLFVSGERLVSAPAEELGRVQRFLGLRPVVGERHFTFNATKGFPCLQRSGGRRPHCLGKTKGRPHPRIEADAIRRLREFYRPHNEEFYRMVGHDFGWD